MEHPNPYQPPSDMKPRLPPPEPVRPGSGLDFGRSMGFFFQDPEWVKKMLIGSLFSILSMVLVGAFFVAGYMIRLIRRSARGEPYPLPDWDDLGGLFADGASAIGAYLAYILPPVALFVVVVAGLTLPGAGEGEASPGEAVVIVLAAMGMSLVLLAVMALVPAALTRLAVEERFGAAFELEQNLSFIARNGGNYVLAILIFILANFLSQFGILLCCVGLFPASFWASAVGAYALGEVALRDRERVAPLSSRS